MSEKIKTILRTALAAGASIEDDDDEMAALNLSGGTGSEVVHFVYPLAARNHESLTQYTHYIDRADATTSLDNAMQLLVWCNSWGVVHIENVPTIPKSEVVKGLGNALMNSPIKSSDASAAAIYETIYTIMSTFLNGSEIFLLDTAPSFSQEKICMTYTDASCVPELMSRVCNVLIRLVTFDASTIEHVPLMPVEFYGIYILLFCAMSMSDIAHSEYFCKNKIAVNLFGMLSIDVISDAVNTKMWINAQKGTYPHSIYADFFQRNPEFRNCTSSERFQTDRRYHASIMEYLDKRPELQPLKLSSYLASKLWCESDRLQFMLSQFQMNLEIPRFCGSLHEDLSVYVMDEMTRASPTAVGKFMVYGDRLFSIILNADGIMDLFAKNNSALDQEACKNLLAEYNSRS
ncbi:MAG: hypothetical protein MUO31_07115 [Thermodesulfovibrionales bacterium]|nr:hypothetical protein [Thermodesulfovibrionales bacterium]